ncbi:hypothetical protein ANN_08499 [Periplaneta americana]|uniref:Uncharacterized protein n=1 Tax=Periplaneta americana TaxID=6978 RepID=A0ABQ8T359_PERAM|nr:hypothetical protein ANN_08499 [Periplaneta americana]
MVESTSIADDSDTHIVHTLQLVRKFSCQICKSTYCIILDLAMVSDSKMGRMYNVLEGQLNAFVYTVKINDMDHLKERITEAMPQITSIILTQVYRNWEDQIQTDSFHIDLLFSSYSDLKMKYCTTKRLRKSVHTCVVMVSASGRETSQLGAREHSPIPMEMTSHFPIGNRTRVRYTHYRISGGIRVTQFA